MSELAEIKARLSESKQDRSKPLDPKFVTQTYLQFESAVAKIDHPENDPEACDVLHVLSLALMTVGLSRSTPSQYAIGITLERLLSHLEFRPMFTIHEAQVVYHRLNSARERLDSVENDDLEVSDKVKRMVCAKIDNCAASLEIIQNLLKSIPEEDIHLYSQVVYLRRDMFNTVLDENFSPKNLSASVSKINQIQHHLDHTNYTPCPMVRHHLEACKFIAGFYKDGPRYDVSLAPEYEKLSKMQKDLTVLLVTRRWTLRETDIYNYQIELGKLDSRVVASLKDLPAFQLPELDASVDVLRKSFEVAGPYLLAFFMVRKSHSLIYKFLDNAEPVTEALQPIFNQLTTTKRCLLDVKSLGGLSNLQELYPYQIKLASMEKQRSDGKFMVDGDVPAGQGILNNLLAECYDLVYELEVDLEERPQSDDDDYVSDRGDVGDDYHE